MAGYWISQLSFCWWEWVLCSNRVLLVYSRKTDWRLLTRRYFSQIHQLHWPRHRYHQHIFKQCHFAHRQFEYCAETGALKLTFCEQALHHTYFTHTHNGKCQTVRDRWVVIQQAQNTQSKLYERISISQPNQHRATTSKLLYETVKAGTSGILKERTREKIQP